MNFDWITHGILFPCLRSAVSVSADLFSASNQRNGHLQGKTSLGDNHTSTAHQINQYPLQQAQRDLANTTQMITALCRECLLGLGYSLQPEYVCMERRMHRTHPKAMYVLPMFQTHLV